MNHLERSWWGNRRILGLTRRCGFSLLELLAVISILAIITAVVLPRMSITGVAAKEQVRDWQIADLNKALERFRMDSGHPATSLKDLEAAGYYPEGVPLSPVINQPYTIDSVTGRIEH